MLFPIPSRRHRSISCSDTGPFLELLSSSPVGCSGDGNNVPDVIVTRRSRSDSVWGRTYEDIETGAVKYFCRSKGHGFITPDSVSWM